MSTTPLKPHQAANLELGRRVRAERGSPQLTPGVRAVLVAQLTWGAFVAEAAHEAGVKPGTLAYWIARGRRGAGPYVALAEAFDAGARRRDWRQVERARVALAALRRRDGGQ